jgi:nucleotide-binding universal stress UspA family protein
MYKHILLAIDLQHKDSWAKSLPTAVEYAKAFGSTLHVMTVVPDFGMSIVGSFFPKGFEEKSLDQAMTTLHDWASENIPSNIKIQHVIGHGTPYEEILRVAGENVIDLVVMGSHRPTMQNFLVGPNTSRVVRHANCSVLVVRE